MNRAAESPLAPISSRAYDSDDFIWGTRREMQIGLLYGGVPIETCRPHVRRTRRINI